jgi:hypothetical protein
LTDILYEEGGPPPFSARQIKLLDQFDSITNVGPAGIAVPTR